MAKRIVKAKKAGKKSRKEQVRIKHLIRILRKDLNHIKAVLYALKSLNPEMVIPLSTVQKKNIFVTSPKQADACAILGDAAAS